MADNNQSSPTQEAAAQVVNKITADAQRTTVPNPSTVANAPGNLAPSNRALELPPILKQGGSKK